MYYFTDHNNSIPRLGEFDITLNIKQDILTTKFTEQYDEMDTVKLRTPDQDRTVKIVNFPNLKRSGTLLVRTLLSRNKLVREICGPVVSWSESSTLGNLYSRSVWRYRSVLNHQYTAQNLDLPYSLLYDFSLSSKIVINSQSKSFDMFLRTLFTTYEIMTA